MERIFSAMKKIVEMRPEVELIFPVHPNPKVRTVADKYLKGMDRVHLIEPLSYEPFCNLMAKSHIVVTDSGGVQEEAPTLGKPVLVVREETERPEGIEAGTAKLLGTDEAVIIEEVLRLLDDENSYKSMANAVNPYGDGYASKRIVEIICNRFL